MSRTRRIYNRQEINGYFHPYRQVCMGHCPTCKHQYTDAVRKRDQIYADILRSELMCAEQECNSTDTPETPSMIEDHLTMYMEVGVRVGDETRWGSIVINASWLSTELTSC